MNVPRTDIFAFVTFAFAIKGLCRAFGCSILITIWSSLGYYLPGP